MIKFKALIHKMTGKVITYTEWLEKIKNYEEIKFFIEGDGTYMYDSKTILYCDHFEIIYDSDFTKDEIMLVYKLTDDIQRKSQLNRILCEKIETEKDLKYKYGVEL